MITHETHSGEDYTVVSGNVGGDGEPEFKINIKGLHDLGSSDFTL